MTDETVHHDRFGSNALYGREGADVFVFGPDNGYDTHLTSSPMAKTSSI